LIEAKRPKRHQKSIQKYIEKPKVKKTAVLKAEI
jgi:hypothetical protein